MIFKFFVSLFLVIFLQPFFPSLFFFLLPILNDFFQNKIKELVFVLIFLSLLTDLIFLKQPGFFLVLTSFSLLIITFLEKILSSYFFYHKLIYLICFNLVFLFLFFYFGYHNFLFWPNFIRVFTINIVCQTIYLVSKNLIRIK